MKTTPLHSRRDPQAAVCPVASLLGSPVFARMCGIGMCLAWVSAVHGGVIFDNFDEGGGFHPQDNSVAASAVIDPPFFTFASRAAAQFTVAGRDSTLNSITLPVSVDKASGAPDVFQVRLAEDNGGVPGTTVEVLSSNGSQWPALANPFTTTTTLASTGHPVLLQGRSYWIVTELTALPAQNVDCRWFLNNTSGNEVPFCYQQVPDALPADPWDGSPLAANVAFRVEGDPLPQIPQLINYQGRVAVGTPAVNFEGDGQFKFALVDGGSSQTLWSNDGTGSAGSEPDAAVTLPVTKGLYSVLLGNATLDHMTAIPYSVFARLDVRLRVWFDDGTHGFQLLTPDQRIAAAGYAMMAANVPDGTITGTKLAEGAVGSASIAAGAIGSTQLAANAVQSSNIAANAVQGGNIAAGAVGSTQIASGAIGFSALAKPPQAGTVDSTGLTFDFGQASFSVAFPQPFAATPVVTLSLAPTSSSFPAEATAHVTSSGATQFTGKVAAFTSTPVTLDSTGGNFTSLAVVNGNPAISYSDSTNDDLKFLRAINASGTAWGVPVILDSMGEVGYCTSLRVVNGNPAISYLDWTNGDLKYVRANNASGTAWGTPVTPDSAGQVGDYTSLAVVNGNPAISYQDYTNYDLKYVRANDVNGTTWGTPITLDSIGNVGFYISLAVVNGNPAISYFDATNGDLKYIRATNPSGTAWATPVTLDSTGVVGENTSLAVVNGNPAVGYYDVYLNDLKFVRATDASGTGWGTPVTLDSTGGTFISLAVVNAKPAISYYNSTSGALKYVRANDASGTAWGTPVTLDSTGDVGSFSSLAVVDGRPAVSYHNTTTDDLKFIREENPPAFKINWIALPP